MAVGDTPTATQLHHGQHDARRSYFAGISYGIATGTLWSVIFVAPKMLPQFSSLALSAARYVLYDMLSLVLTLLMWRTLWHKMTGREWVVSLLLSLPGNTLYYLCVADDVQYAGVAPVSFTVGLLLVMVTLAGAAGRGSLPLRQLALPLPMAVTGVVCIYLDTPDVYSSVNGRTCLFGLLMAAGTLACWTVYTVCNARYLCARPQLTSRRWSLLTGVATGVPSLTPVVPAFLLSGIATASTQPLSAWGMFWLVNIGITLGAPMLRNSLQNAASRELSLTSSKQLIVLEVVFALLYGFIYEVRWSHGLEVAAAALLMSGMGLTARRCGQGLFVRVLDLMVYPPFIPCRGRLTFLCLAKEK